MIKIGSYEWQGKRNYIISLFGKLVMFSLPTVRSLKNKLFHFFYIVKEDYDCDGVTLTIDDRLTGGKIYSAYSWNFTRAGGSTGAIIYRFGRPDKDNGIEE